tara:strand:- start:824 stop:1069 length:246 start_codon:yes stop_codon:yes gene_type:complete
MTLRNDDNWEAQYEKERKQALNKIIRTTCYKCGIKCKDVSDYTMGETYNEKWFCFDHVDLLYKSLGATNTSEFWEKTSGSG